MEYLLIFISAIFVNNIVLSQFLGICPFLGVSKKVDTAIGMGGAIAFVLTLATIITWCVQKYVLDPFGLQYLQTLAFILVIAALVQMVEIILKKVSPALYQALGIFLPLITTNCAVLGVAILVIQKDYNLLESVVYAFSTALGFALALIVFAGIREQQALVRIPKGMQGVAIVYRHGNCSASQPCLHGILGRRWRFEIALRIGVILLLEVDKIIMGICERCNPMQIPIFCT